MRKKVNRSKTASKIVFDRYYRGRPKKIARLREIAQDMAIGDRVRALREQVGLTQAQLARKIGSQPSQISRIEDADYEGHSVQTLRKIARALHARLEIQFVIANAPSPPRRSRAA
jgi:ribosome-binding protein aMBF1 (putative translation factor)